VDENVSASLTNIQMTRFGGGVIPVVMDHAGSIVGVSVACSAARTAGTATFTVFLNGLTTGFSVVLDGTNTNNFSNTQASGTNPFAVTGRIDVRETTTSTWAPTTTDCEATVTVQY
jgi:hypothetical protein